MSRSFPRASWLIALSVGFLVHTATVLSQESVEPADPSVIPVDDRVDRLQSTDIETRRQAAIETYALDRSLQQQILPDMIARLDQDRDGQVRLAIMETLTAMGPDARPAIDVLVKAMREDFGGRNNEELHQDYRAALALAAIGAPAVPALQELLDSAEPTNIRAEAAMALGRIGAPAAVAANNLIGMLSDEQLRLRREATVALANIGDPVRTLLLQAAQHERSSVRAGAIEALGGCASGDDVDVIANAVDDVDAHVRAAAIGALRNLPLDTQRHRSMLLRRLSDGDEAVRLAVVNSLLDQPEMLALIATELPPLMYHADDGVAWHAAYLLQGSHSLQGIDATDLLLQVASDPRSRLDQVGRALAFMGASITEHLHAALKHQNARVRQAAARALGDIRPVAEQTAQQLALGLDDGESAVQSSCLESLGRLGRSGRPALSAIRAQLNHPQSEMRAATIDVLVRVAPRDQRMVEDFMSMVDDRDPQVQSRAIDAIAAAGPMGRQAIATVVPHLRSSYPAVRLSAATMIGRHGATASQALPTLLDVLADSDQPWRLTVLSTLGQLGSAAQPALPQLTALLQDSSAAIREAALSAIGELELPAQQIVPLVATGLQDDDSEVRGRAIRIARQLGRDATGLVPDLIALAANEDESRSVERALERLQRYPVDSAIVPALADLLDHQSPQVRILAIRFLGLAGDHAIDVLPRLRELAEHEDEAVRSEASTAIENLQSPRP